MAQGNAQAVKRKRPVDNTEEEFDPEVVAEQIEYEEEDTGLPVEFEDEHSVLTNLRQRALAARGGDEEIVWPSTGVPVRMRLLSQDEMARLQLNSGTTLNTETSRMSRLSIDIVRSAITHIDETPIEDLVPRAQKMPQSSLADRQARRDTAIRELTSYYKELITQTDLEVFIEHYSKLIAREEKAIRQVNKTQKKS